MRLVVDTNILLSFFRENLVRFIIVNSDFLGIELFCPEHAIKELKKNESDILEYSNLNSKQFNEALSELSNFIKIPPKESSGQFEPEAKRLIHDKDVPIFALALKLGCAIWSNEPAFKRQSKVEILSSGEMIKLFDSSLP